LYRLFKSSGKAYIVVIGINLTFGILCAVAIVVLSFLGQNDAEIENIYKILRVVCILSCFWGRVNICLKVYLSKVLGWYGGDQGLCISEICPKTSPNSPNPQIRSADFDLSFKKSPIPQIRTYFLANFQIHTEILRKHIFSLKLWFFNPKYKNLCRHWLKDCVLLYGNLRTGLIIKKRFFGASAIIWWYFGGGSDVICQTQNGWGISKILFYGKLDLIFAFNGRPPGRK